MSLYHGFVLIKIGCVYFGIYLKLQCEVLQKYRSYHEDDFLLTKKTRKTTATLFRSGTQTAIRL